MKLDDPKAPGLDALIEDAALRTKLSAVDLGLAREIAFGVARNRFWLGQLLGRFLRQPMKEEASAARMALLSGAYQLAFLDRVPPHAAVDETVRLVAAQPKGWNFRGLANAVMRRISELPPEQRRPPEPAPWRVRHSVPAELASLVGKVLQQDELELFFAACNSTAPLCMRLRAKGSELAALAKQVRAEIAELTEGTAVVRTSKWLPDCLIAEGRALFPERLLSFRTGRMTIEDEGAQLAAMIAASDAGPRVLDLCASPGGKTAHLLDHLGESASVTAADVSDTKLVKLRETLTRMGLEDRVDLVDSAWALKELRPGTFDLVLVDAPCSGVGTLRRHPEIRYRRKPEDLTRLAILQRDLLNRAARLVTHNGLLAYTICTISPQEGEEVVRDFLANHRDFRLAPAPENLPFDPESFSSSTGLFHTWTHRHGCDSFTIVRFRRNS